MARTLITGVAGFTGRYVARLLAERGHENSWHRPRGRRSVRGSAPDLTEADLADLRSVAQIVENVRPEHVLHLAGVAFVAHSDVEEIYRSNVLGTRQLLEALAILSHAPSSVLLASSANVYGNAREGEFDENTAFAPADDYGVSKVAMEYGRPFIARVCRLSLHGHSTTPDEVKARSSSFQRSLRTPSKGRRLSNLATSRSARTFSDVRAIAQMYSRLLDEPKAIGGTYNVCSGTAVTLQQVLKEVWRLSGHSFEVRVNPMFVRANEVRVLQGSKKKIESVIGPTPSIPLEETLRWMLDT